MNAQRRTEPQPAHHLRCLACGATRPDRGELACDCAGPGLLRSEYERHRLEPRHEGGVGRFADWLPLDGPVAHVGRPAVYRATALGNALGLERLWVAFSGWWPERGATLTTCSFKELEAPVVLGRLGPDARTLVVASAGNTARAFATVASDSGHPVLLVVPDSARHAIWSVRPFGPSVRLVTVGDGADYLDAIEVAGAIAELPGFVPEGGTRNVARRDGLGTPVLAAALAMGQIPDHYVQAVGSGAGGIAAWEASRRLRRDGRFGDHPMRLHLAQNLPFAPMTEAWRRGSRTLARLDSMEADARIRALRAPVLSNRKPPYAVAGGVFDALTDTDGHMYGVHNAEVDDAARLFETLEGIDLDPAAAVALAALRQATVEGSIGRGDAVLLHVTGGGRRRLLDDRAVHHLAPSLCLGRGEVTRHDLRTLFAHSMSTPGSPT